MKTQIESPTQEQFNQGEYKTEDVSPVAGSPKRYRRTDTCELDRLLYANLITPDEHSTLNNLASDLNAAGMIFSVRSSMEPGSTTGNAQFMADTMFARTRRINEQMNILWGELGRPSANLVLSMLTSDLRVSPGAMPVVKKAAAVLRPFYF
ncbi:hypothetical protein UFOVP28_75 [uncultured Caudovirales phage]|uniref:Uncharacterized protein n=1 Tax=uncultured Caudovirales phage TaxID=2100421 RepID=A0A6J5KKY3_9CAUD|nr:hypothetical protein UFOVP28_75 [uncultured Caudovirales phage]